MLEVMTEIVSPRLKSRAGWKEILHLIFPASRYPCDSLSKRCDSMKDNQPQSTADLENSCTVSDEETNEQTR
jgi:hypothetical protein